MSKNGFFFLSIFDTKLSTFHKIQIIFVERVNVTMLGPKINLNTLRTPMSTAGLKDVIIADESDVSPTTITYKCGRLQFQLPDSI